MSAIDTNRALRVTTPSFGFGAKILAAMIAWNDARVTKRELGLLSDRELSDIGLSRGDIDRIAYNR